MKRLPTPALTLLAAFAVLIAVLAAGCSSTPGTSSQALADAQKNIADLQSELAALQNENQNLKQQVQDLSHQVDQLNLQIKEGQVLGPNPKLGEIWVEGSVLGLDLTRRIITIDQHMDDNSVRIDPKVPVLKGAYLEKRTMGMGANGAEIVDVQFFSDGDLSRIHTGDTIRFVYLQDKKAAKAIIIETMEGS